MDLLGELSQFRVDLGRHFDRPSFHKFSSTRTALVNQRLPLVQVDLPNRCVWPSPHLGAQLSAVHAILLPADRLL